MTKNERITNLETLVLEQGEKIEALDESLCMEQKQTAKLIGKVYELEEKLNDKKKEEDAFDVFCKKYLYPTLVDMGDIFDRIEPRYGYTPTDNDMLVGWVSKNIKPPTIRWSTFKGTW